MTAHLSPAMRVPSINQLTTEWVGQAVGDYASAGREYRK